MSEFPQIFAFYSFKGGVGRSMALLNVAYALAAKGRHVLVLDMDLEAPGVSGFLHREGEIPGFARLDMVDLVGWAKSIPLPLAPESFLPLSDYAVSVPREKLESIPRVFSDLGRLDIIPVDEERDYYSRLTALALNSSDQNDLVRIGSVLRAWLKSLRFPIEVPDYYGPDYERTATYDYVLVDSRTGITETGGLCIGPLSDQLVVLTALNDQNVEGTRKFLREVGILAGREGAGAADEAKPCLIVASLVPSGEIETKQKRLESLEQALGRASVRLSYHPQLALEESIFTRDYRSEYLAHEYDELLRHLLHMASDGGDAAPPETISTLDPRSVEFREALRNLIRSVSVTGSGSSLYYILSMSSTMSLSEVDYGLWDSVCRVLSSERSPSLLDVLYKWANLLVDWGFRSQDPKLAMLRFGAASVRCDQILHDGEASSVQIARALGIRGTASHLQGQQEQAIADYTAVLDMSDAPIQQKVIALCNRGLAYSELDEMEKAIADFSAVIQMSDEPFKQESSVQLFQTLAHGQTIVPAKSSFGYTSQWYSAYSPLANQKAYALVSRGLMYDERGEPEKAIADFTVVIKMFDAPSDQKARARAGRGHAYVVLGRYAEAIEDEQQAIALNPGYWRSHAILALALLLDSQTRGSLNTYDASLALANSENIDDMMKDLREAIEKHGPISGADEVMARLEARREVLIQQVTTGDNGPVTHRSSGEG